MSAIPGAAGECGCGAEPALFERAGEALVQAQRLTGLLRSAGIWAIVNTPRAIKGPQLTVFKFRLYIILG